MTSFAGVELGVVLDNLFLGHAASGCIGTVAVVHGRAWQIRDGAVLRALTRRRDASVGRGLLEGVRVLEDACEVGCEWVGSLRQCMLFAMGTYLSASWTPRGASLEQQWCEPC